MEIDHNMTENETAEGGEQESDFWSDEGAQRINEMLDEGSAYARTGAQTAEDLVEADSMTNHPNKLIPGTMTTTRNPLRSAGLGVVAESNNC